MPTRFTDSTPPTYDPAIQATHVFVEKPDPRITDYMRQQYTPPPDQLPPGAQYLDTRTGCIVTVLTPQAQAEQDRKARELHKFRLRQGLESEERCLAHVRETIVGYRAEVGRAWAVARSQKPLKPADADVYTIRARQREREQWVEATNRLENAMENELALAAGVAGLRKSLRDA